MAKRTLEQHLERIERLGNAYNTAWQEFRKDYPRDKKPDTPAKRRNIKAINFAEWDEMYATKNYRIKLTEAKR